MSGRHRKPTTSNIGVAKVAFTGAVVGGSGLALAGHATAATDSEWDKVASCESTNNWGINTGNGYQGGLQFSPSTWSSHGGGDYASGAHQASREQQIAVAERVLANQGRGAWPTCGSALSGPSQRDVPANSSADDDSAVEAETVGLGTPAPPPFELPKAPEGWAPFPWELPPPAEDLPPAPEDLPPAPEDLPPAPEDAPGFELPKAPEGWAPFPWELPPPAEDLPPAPEDLPAEPDDQQNENDRPTVVEAGYVDQLQRAIQSQNVADNNSLTNLG